MALTRLRVVIGANTFEVEGDFTDEDVSALVRTWVNAQAPDETPTLIDQLADTLDQQTQQLAATVAATTPAAQP